MLKINEDDELKGMCSHNNQIETFQVPWDELELFLLLQCSVLHESSPMLITQDGQMTCKSCEATPDGVFQFQKGSDLLGWPILTWPGSTAWWYQLLSNYLWCCWQCGVGAWCVAFLCCYLCGYHTISYYIPWNIIVCNWHDCFHWWKLAEDHGGAWNRSPRNWHMMTEVIQ